MTTETADKARSAPRGAARSLVVVLNYKGRDDTMACVASIVGGSPGHEVLVIDNGSGDQVLDAVAVRWPGVATLQNESNLGFAGGMNRGLDWAKAHGFDVVTILNNDTVVAPGALDLLVGRALVGDVAVSPVITYRGSSRTWFAGGGTDPRDALPRHLSDDEVDALRRGTARGPYRTELLAGCCVTARATTWATVGGFDERFFLNFEDSEWSLRAARAGVALEVLPSATIAHAVSASFTGAYSYLGTYYYARNSLLYARLARSGPRRTLLMLRHRVLPSPWRSLREDGVREGVRRGVMVTAGVGSHALRRYGRAPRWIEAVASRWSSVPPASRSTGPEPERSGRQRRTVVMTRNVTAKTR